MVRRTALALTALNAHRSMPRQPRRPARSPCAETSRQRARFGPVWPALACTPPCAAALKTAGQLGQLGRCITQPALARDGAQTKVIERIVLRLETHCRGGTAHPVISRLEFMQRRAAQGRAQTCTLLFAALDAEGLLRGTESSEFLVRSGSGW